MGLRGPIGMSDEERSARGARDRRVDRVPVGAKTAWQARAERLETLGLAMIEQASKPAKRSRGRARSPASAARRELATVSAGLKLLEAADRLWLRLGRVAPPPAAKPARAESLEEYRRRRPRA